MDEQLTHEELFEKYEYLCKITVSKMYHNVQNYAESRGLDEDDLLQYARLGLLKGIQTWCPEKHSHLKYKSFLIRNIKWIIPRYLYNEGSTYLLKKAHYVKDDNKAKVLSMSGTPSDESDSNFYDIVSQDNIYNFESIYPNPESSLLSKQLEDRLLNKLNDKERKVVVMKLKEDLTYQEIGERMGYTKQGIGQIFKKIEEKYKEYFYNIAEVTT